MTAFKNKGILYRVKQKYERVPTSWGIVSIPENITIADKTFNDFMEASVFRSKFLERGYKYIYDDPTTWESLIYCNNKNIYLQFIDVFRNGKITKDIRVYVVHAEKEEVGFMFTYHEILQQLKDLQKSLQIKNVGQLELFNE